MFLVVFLSTCNEERDKPLILSSISAVFRIRNCLTFSVYFGRFLSHWKIHKSPCCDCYAELPEREAHQLCLHLYYALVTLGLNLTFKTTVNFLCHWQLNGDAYLPDHSVRELWQINLLSKLALTPLISYILRPTVMNT